MELEKLVQSSGAGLLWAQHQERGETGEVPTRWKELQVPLIAARVLYNIHNQAHGIRKVQHYM